MSPSLSRVLVADPDTDTRSLYRTAFQQIPTCDVVEAVDGRDALVKAFTHCPSLVMMELRLSLIDGFELCGLLRRDYQTRSVPILVVTGESRLAELERAYQKGADLVLVKPVASYMILERCRTLVERAADIQVRSSALRARASAELARANAVCARVREPHVLHSRSLERFTTTTPPPHALRCPVCDRQLEYVGSYVGGVNEKHNEQWDTLTCASGCGTFEYRHRTRGLRRISDHSQAG